MFNHALLMLVRGSTGLPLDHGNRIHPIKERLKDPADARRATRHRLGSLRPLPRADTTHFNPMRRRGTLVPTPCS